MSPMLGKMSPKIRISILPAKGRTWRSGGVLGQIRGQRNIPNVEKKSSQPKKCRKKEGN